MPPHRPRRRQGWQLVVVVLAVVGVVAVAFVATRGEDEDAGQDATSVGQRSGGDQDGAGQAEGDGQAETWTAPAVEGDHGELVRTLAVGTQLAVVTQRDLTTLDRSTGEETLFRSLEEDDQDGYEFVMCGAASAPRDDRYVAVTLGLDDSPGDGDFAPTCGLVGMLDVETGDVANVMDLTVDASPPASPPGTVGTGMPTEVIGDTVVVAWGSAVVGLDVADLAVSWQWDASSLPGREAGGCSISDMVPGEADHVVVMSNCTDPATGGSLYGVVELDAEGEIGRSHDFSSDEVGVEISEIGGATLHVLFGAPLVVQTLNAGSEEPSSIVTLDDAWDVLGVVRGEYTVLSVGGPVPVGVWTRPSRSGVVGTTLISFTAPNQGANELVAVDLATGDEMWTTSLPSGFVFWQVLSVDDETVVALAAQTGADAGPGLSVVTIDRNTGDVRDEATSEVVDPQGDPLASTMQVWTFVWADGRAYGVHDEGGAGVEGTWSAFTVGDALAGG